jgi:hypothetical protein
MGGDYSSRRQAQASAEQVLLGSGFHSALRDGMANVRSKIMLADSYFARTNELFFEMNGRLLIHHHSQMSGNPVKIRDGCATVTATNSNATEASGRRKAV